MLFPLGQIVATPGALHVLERCHVDPHALLSRHQIGDWGELCPADRDENELSVKQGFRILSNYQVGASGSSPKRTGA